MAKMALVVAGVVLTAGESDLMEVVEAPTAEAVIMAEGEGRMAGAITITGEVIMGEVIGVEASGSAQDGVGDGEDGVHGGGALRSILTTHHPLW
jgi:hypothetical protein